MEINEQLISVIVPVYNVEKYLKKCIRSIINQTYKNLEIILVDDGSTDKSGEICDKYGEKDKRIKVLHKSNGGLSDARNEGLKIATGEWIFFVDSDDFLLDDSLRLLYEISIKEQADVIIGEMTKTYTSNDICNITRAANYEVLSRKNAIFKYFYRIIPGYACGKLYKRDLITDITFPKGKIFEDAFVVYKYLDMAEKVVYTSNIIYCYRQRKNSIIHSKYTHAQMDIIEANQQALEYFKNECDDTKKSIASKRFVSSVDVLRKIPSGKAYINDRKLLIKEINATRGIVLKDDNNSIIVRFMALFSFISIRLLAYLTKAQIFMKIKRV